MSENEIRLDGFVVQVAMRFSDHPSDKGGETSLSCQRNDRGSPIWLLPPGTNAKTLLYLRARGESREDAILNMESVLRQMGGRQLRGSMDDGEAER